MSKKFEVVWASVAEKDLADIVKYVANDNPKDALKLLKKIKNSAGNLYRLPERGRIVPELKKQGIFHYRELIVSPWRLLYRIERSKVYVLAVLDSRRNIEDVLLKRLLDA